VTAYARRVPRARARWTHPCAAATRTRLQTRCAWLRCPVVCAARASVCTAAYIRCFQGSRRSLTLAAACASRPTRCAAGVGRRNKEAPRNHPEPIAICFPPSARRRRSRKAEESHRAWCIYSLRHTFTAGVSWPARISARSSDEMMLKSIACGHSDCCEMRVDGARTDEQLAGDLPIDQSLRNRTQHLNFPGRQSVERALHQSCLWGWFLWNHLHSQCGFLCSQRLLAGQSLSPRLCSKK
jgi:hypothetical protein